MRCSYSLMVRCRCPVDDLTDTYDVTIDSATTIKVEDILEITKPLASTKMFQEDLTAALARALGARVVTIGYHSGVLTTVTAP